MYFIKNLVTISLIVATITACSKKEQEKKPVYIQPALLDTIFNNTFEGVIPCPDCPGIETSIRIYNDSTISRTIYYQDKNELPITKIGTWKLKDSIFQATFDREKPFYKIKSPNQILRVGSDLKEVEGDLAIQYVLTKAKPLNLDKINGKYIVGDTLNLFNELRIKHQKKDLYTLEIKHFNKLDSVNNCLLNLKASLGKDHQLSVPMNDKNGRLKVIFTKKEAHLLYEDISKDSAFFKCNDSLRLLPIEGSYKKIEQL